MSYNDAPTTELLETYFKSDMILDGRTPGVATLGDVADLLMELDRRGVCVRATEPPAWYDDGSTPTTPRGRTIN